MKSQSAIYNKTKMFIPQTKQKTEANSQSRNYVSERMMRIISMNEKAYWIKNNTFFTASIVDGNIDYSTAKEVDTINMSKKDLDIMLSIIDSLKENK